MQLKEVSLEEMRVINMNQSQRIREILNQFKESDMRCAEIVDWDEIATTIEKCRQAIKQQISYRNGRVYEGISVRIRTTNGFRVYLVKEDNSNE